MVREAAEWNEEDQIAVGRVEALGRLEAYVYDARTALKDKALRGRMEEDDLLAVQEALADTDRCSWLGLGSALGSGLGSGLGLGLGLGFGLGFG